MIRVFRTSVGLIALAVALAASPAAAQLEDTLEDLTADVAEGYLGPLAHGMSASLNSGIFRTGHVPSAGLNLTLDFKAVIVGFSDEDQTFTPANLPAGFSTGGVPTVVGSLEAGEATGPGGATILYPSGFDLEHFGLVVPQLTVGSIMGTRAFLRWIPSVELGDEGDDLGKISFFGIGAQHSISQYLPGLPVEIAGGAMYQKLTIGDDLLKSSAVAFNVTASKSFGMIVSIEPYVGLGIDSFQLDVAYTYEEGSTSQDLEVNFDRETDPHMTLGTNLNLPGVKLHGEIFNAAENGYAVGLSFGI